jgi:2-alkyl-3-oxoalkanoate reductase
MRQAVAAMNHLDEAVTEAGGIALRYGNFYGDPGDGWPDVMRAR